MKKISKKLSLVAQTVRVLSSDQLSDVAGGGHAVPTTTIMRVSLTRANATPIACQATGGVHTAPCRYPG
ncbi:MAG TPA: class I lanthipeptide [Kofleriaceae bacterium]|nr:class I lanthipeptide [Kofleriaceae bacterium]